jgi:hypothetical protein
VVEIKKYKRKYLESHTTSRLSVDSNIEEDFWEILGSHFKI